MLAVSSNAQRVIIFAFALTKDGSDSPILEDDIMDMDEEGVAASRKLFVSRKTNLRINLPVAGANIPCIAFCNTGDDPEGRYIASGDIDGIMRIWDIEKMKAVSTRTTYCKKDGNGNCQCSRYGYGYDHAIWSVGWLDKRSFRKAHTIEEAAGCKLWKTVPERTVYPDTLQLFNVAQGKAEHAIAREDNVRFDSNGLVPSEPSTEDGDSDYAQDPEQEMDPAAEQPEDAMEEGQHGGHEVEEDQQNISEAGAIPGEVSGEILDENVAGSLWPSATSIRAKASHYHVLESDPEIALSPNGLPNCPTFQVQVHDTFLLQPHMNAMGDGGDMTPYIFLDDPTFLGNNEFRMFDQERHTMTVHIPELGIIVVGNTKGHAAVLSLASYEDPKVKAGEHDGRYHIYFFRYDHLLLPPPRGMFEGTGNQYIDRAPGNLVGIAAGPVQGMLGRRWDGVRRWRIMLTYRDQSVMSYEVGRMADDKGVDVDALVI